MDRTRPIFPTILRTGWIDFSPALHWHIPRLVESALQDFASRIASVKVQIAIEDNFRARTCTIEVRLKPAGCVAASATGSDALQAVERATERIVAEIWPRRRGDASGSGELARIA